MLPKAARVISERWYNVLADMAYLRMTYRHTHAGHMAPWAEQGALLAERLDMMAALMPALAEDGGDSTSSLATEIFDPFL
eukprot:11855099-Alexandrium_andersonii.AAC.1